MPFWISRASNEGNMKVFCQFVVSNDYGADASGISVPFKEIPCYSVVLFPICQSKWCYITALLLKGTARQRVVSYDVANCCACRQIPMLLHFTDVIPTIRSGFLVSVGI